MITLNARQIAAYHDDGVLFPFAVLTPEDRAAGLRVVERIDSMSAEARKGLLLHKTYIVSKTLDRHVPQSAYSRPRRGFDRA